MSSTEIAGDGGPMNLAFPRCGFRKSLRAVAGLTTNTRFDFTLPPGGSSLSEGRGKQSMTESRM